MADKWRFRECALTEQLAHTAVLSRGCLAELRSVALGM